MNLQERFERIRRLYFPRWDRNKEWSFSRDAQHSMGLCDRNSKTISVVVSPTFQEFDEILIHEIAHAATICGHTSKWQDRMKIAAERAKELGETQLAASLLEDVTNYQKYPDLTFKQAGIVSAYREVLENMPDTSFKKATALIQEDLGCTSRQLEHSCKRLPLLYQVAKQEIDDYRELLSRRRAG